MHRPIRELFDILILEIKFLWVNVTELALQHSMTIFTVICSGHLIYTNSSSVMQENFWHQFMFLLITFLKELESPSSKYEYAFTIEENLERRMCLIILVTIGPALVYMHYVVMWSVV